MRKSFKDILFIALGLVILGIIVTRLFSIDDPCSLAVDRTYEKTIGGIDYKIGLGRSPAAGNWYASSSYTAQENSFNIRMSHGGRNPLCADGVNFDRSIEYVSYIETKNIDLKSSEKIILQTEGNMIEYTKTDPSRIGILIGITDGNKIIEKQIYEVHSTRDDTTDSKQISAVIIEKIDKTNYLVNGYVLDLAELDQSKDWNIRLKLYTSKSGSSQSTADLSLDYLGATGIKSKQQPIVSLPIVDTKIPPLQQILGSSVITSYIFIVFLVLVVGVLFFWIIKKK